MPLPAAVAGVRRQAIARASVSALVASLPVLYVSLLRPPPAALAGDTAFWFLMSNCVIAAIVATSADAGTLLFRSKDDHDECFPCASAGLLPPPVAAQDIGSDAVAPLAPASVSQDETPVVGVDGNGGNVQGEVASAVTSSHPVDHALPPVMEGEEEEERVTDEPSTVNNSTIEVEEAQGEGDGKIVPLATIEEGSELAEPEPESWSRLTSTKSLPEEGADDGEWPAALYSHRSPEAITAQDKGAVAEREGGLRRSATVGSKPAAEESDYWELSDEELNRRVEDFIARFNREMRLQIEQEAGA